MFFKWIDRTFRWFREASEYTGYDREMAKLLKPYLEDCRTVLDIGCGMAFADFFLAPSFDEILCVDMSESVIQNVNERIIEKKIPNLYAICSDGMDKENIVQQAKDYLSKTEYENDGKLADAVISLFHGGEEKNGLQYMTYARKKVIFVVHGSAIGMTGPEKYRVRKCMDVDYTRGWLDANHITYDFQDCLLEFGQPHRSFEEAVNFLKAYTKDEAPEEELVAYAKKTIVETGREDFPYYTPKKRHFGIFAIDVR